MIVTHSARTLDTIRNRVWWCYCFRTTNRMAVVQSTSRPFDSIGNRIAYPGQVAHLNIRRSWYRIRKRIPNRSDRELVGKVVKWGNSVLIRQTNTIGSDLRNRCKVGQFHQRDAPVVHRGCVKVVDTCNKVDLNRLFVKQVHLEMERYRLFVRIEFNNGGC